MLILVIVVGTAVLVGIAVAVGLESGSQDSAWRSIGHQRQELAEQTRLLDEHVVELVEKERELWEWETQLIAAAEGRGCPVCELRRGRGERPAS